MPTHATVNERATARKALTEKLIILAQSGTDAWEREWRLISPGRPFNAISGHRYEGGNRVQLVLGSSWSSPGWLTARQIADFGGRVRDEAPTLIEFWKREEFWSRKQVRVFLDERPVTVEGQDSTGVVVRTVAGEQVRVPTAEVGRRFTVAPPNPSSFSRKSISWERAEEDLSRMTCVNYLVYNLEQCERIDGQRLHRKLRDAAMPCAAGDSAVRQKVRDLLEGLRTSGLTIVEVPSNQPRYSIRADTVYLPAEGQFRSLSGYAATVAHELAHATGAGHRLGRFVGTVWGGEDDVSEHDCKAERAREELIAEMAAAMICADLGVNYSLTSPAAYLGHWLDMLKASDNIAFAAARDAATAADFALGAMEQHLSQRQREEEAQTARATPGESEDAVAGQLPIMGM